MASKFRNDILIPLEIEPIETRPQCSRLAAFVPITLALIGIGAILAGGISAKNHELAGRPVIDPIETGSVPVTNDQRPVTSSQ
jgi:hypothetical protein